MYKTLNLSIIDHSAMSMGMHVLLYYDVFDYLGKTPRSRMARSNEISIFLEILRVSILNCIVVALFCTPIM